MFRLSPDGRQVAVQRLTGAEQISGCWTRRAASPLDSLPTIPSARSPYGPRTDERSCIRTLAQGTSGASQRMAAATLTSRHSRRTGRLPLDWSGNGRWVLARGTEPNTKYNILETGRDTGWDIAGGRGTHALLAHTIQRIDGPLLAGAEPSLGGVHVGRVRTARSSSTPSLCRATRNGFRRPVASFLVGRRAAGGCSYVLAWKLC